MKFNLSKYGILFASVSAAYFLFIFVVDPSEIGPLGFLWYVSIILYFPTLLLSAFIPFGISNSVSFIFSIVIFYFIGAGVEKIKTFNKNR